MAMAVRTHATAISAFLGATYQLFWVLFWLLYQLFWEHMYKNLVATPSTAWNS